ncbi:MAG: hypothetical protein ACOZFS_04295 [Thermodesulfobacteriota bacterium]
MEPKISVCRKGEEIFLTIEGDFNPESSQEFLRLVRQLLTISLKCAEPGSQVTYCLKTRGKVDLGKIAQFQHLSKCRHEVCEYIDESKEQDGPLKNDFQKRHNSVGLFLVKGGAF